MRESVIKDAHKQAMVTASLSTGEEEKSDIIELADQRRFLTLESRIDSGI